MINLNQRIKKYKTNDQVELQSLINDFDPIIRKYGIMLKEEDGHQDMIVEFIKVLNKIPIENKGFEEDKYILGYIKTALKNNYILLNKKKLKIKEMEISNDLTIDITGSYDVNFNDFIIKDSLKSLSNTESTIVKKLILEGIPVSDLAREFHISRQAINQTKIRALNKLKVLMM